MEVPNQTRLSVLSWTTESDARASEAGAFPGHTDIPALPRETLTDFGIYSPNPLRVSQRMGCGCVRLRLPDSKASTRLIVARDWIREPLAHFAESHVVS